MSRLAAWLIAVDLSMTAAGVAHAQVVQRFDYLVREDMFRGFAGDTAALERATSKRSWRCSNLISKACLPIPKASCWRPLPKDGRASARCRNRSST